MFTLGIDLSSQPAETAASLIEWRADRAIVNPPALRCTDAILDGLIAKSDAIGIDAPFGWPEEFVAAVNEWPLDSWTEAQRDRLRFRETDRLIHMTQFSWPLSVSTDRIALPAMRAMSLLKRHGVKDKSGDGRFFEVYPIASLRAWGIEGRGYKNTSAQSSIDARAAILRALLTRMPWLSVPDGYAANSHTLDALIAALSTRVAVVGRSLRPTASVLAAARREGWIHVPMAWPKLDLSA